MTEPTLASAPVPAEKTSVWEDFIDIFHAPSSVFRRREEGSWLVPMAVVTLLLLVIGLLTYNTMRPLYDAMFDKATEKMRSNPAVTEDLIEKSRSFGELTTKYGMVLIIPLTIFVTAFVTWLVGKLFDAKQTLHAAIVVAAYAFVPRVLGGVVNAVVAMMKDPAKLTHPAAITLGPGQLVDPEQASQVLLAVLMRLDVFTIWTTVLLAIGLAVTGRISRERAAIAGVIVWLIGTFPAVMGALRQG